MNAEKLKSEIGQLLAEINQLNAEIARCKAERRLMVNCVWLLAGFIVLMILLKGSVHP